MNFIVADTFIKAIEDLDAQHRKRVKEAVFDFEVNPASPGFQFHKVDKARDPCFWSFRISRDLRGIVHKTDSSIVLCYVDHHDDAYNWATRRVIREHPKTGAVQLVEVVERIEEKLVVRPEYVAPPLFPEERFEDDYLLDLGVPPGWLDAVRRVSEDNLDPLLERLPAEASENLFKLAVGEPVARPSAVREPEVGYGPTGYAHPDSQRRFWIIDHEAELRQALEYPWERWIVFLHPKQRRVVEAKYRGPALASGAAGTGKSVVAVHRAVQLARRYPESPILLTTFSRTLAEDLRKKVRILAGEDDEIAERIDIVHVSKLARDIYVRHYGEPEIVGDPCVRDVIRSALDDASGAQMAIAGLATPHARQADPTRSAPFLLAEWNVVVDAWGLNTWEEYRDASREGRGTPLGVRQRKDVWDVLSSVQAALGSESAGEKPKVTWNELYRQVTQTLREAAETRYGHVVVDEAQDLGPAELQLLRALVPEGPDDLFFAGDIGQRIYKQPFSWQSVGIEVVGRSTRLSLNYRTTQQIRQFADRLMPAKIEGMGEDASRESISLLAGEEPEVRAFADSEEEILGVADILKELVEAGVGPREIAIVMRAVRPDWRRERAETAADLAGMQVHDLEDSATVQEGAVSICSMHRAKGLEFEAVIIMGCDQASLPWKWLLDDVTDPADRDSLLDQERNLLYVASTRARRHLYITYSGMPSRFLESPP